MPPWVAKGKIGALLLASEMPVPISRLPNVFSLCYDVRDTSRSLSIRACILTASQVTCTWEDADRCVTEREGEGEGEREREGEGERGGGAVAESISIITKRKMVLILGLLSSSTLIAACRPFLNRRSYASRAANKILLCRRQALSRGVSISCANSEVVLVLS